jgi:hypothetical protein
MAGERNYLRVPPDSTGKRVRLKHTAQVFYKAKTGGYVWKLGERYTLGTSGWTIHVHGIYESSITSGVLEVHYSKSATYNNLSPIVNETIVDPDTGSTVAQVDSFVDVFVNSNHIIGYDNPENGVDVDATGSMNIRFSEGLPQLDAFGKLRTSGATILGEYVFSSGTLPTQFNGMFMNGGAPSWDPNARALVLTNTTTSGSHSSYTSNTYHHYFPGSSHLFIGTFAMGDSGKTGLMREWGMFDDKNGFFFMMQGTTLGVGFRSNTSGTVIDTFIPQSQWNRDQADGTGSSGMDLDVTKDNIYWIDVQWLGAGRVRYGTYYNGQRLVLHEYYHGNNASTPVTAMGSLPVCVHQTNTGATGSSSEMRAFCMAVWTESTLDVRTTAAPSLRSFSKVISVNDTYQYIGTLSPGLNLPNGQPNRSLYWPTEIEVIGYDTVTGQPVLFEFEIYAEAVLGGTVWNAVSPVSTVQYDTAGTFIASGLAVSQRFVNGRDTIDTTTTYDNMQYGAFKNYSEDGGTVIQNITAASNATTAVLTLGTATRSGLPTLPGRTYFRNAEALTISGVVGMTQLNGNTYYAKPIAANQIELYTDAALTIPVNSTGFGTYTSGGMAMGDFGGRFLFTLVVKKLFGTNPAQFYAKISWKEVVQ